MPTYEYRCDGCGDEFDLEQRITDAKLKKCPKCKKMKLVRLIGTGNFILKGGGWYADLYSSQPKKKADSSESKPEPSKSEPSKSEPSKSESSKSESSKSESSKSEPKPGKKAETKKKASSSD
jgi:putative FmdB family regulatory protein